MTISGPLYEKAKQFHQVLEIHEPCEFMTVRLITLKLCQGIRYLKTNGEKITIDKEAAGKYTDIFFSY